MIEEQKGVNMKTPEDANTKKGVNTTTPGELVSLTANGDTVKPENNVSSDIPQESVMSGKEREAVPDKNLVNSVILTSKQTMIKEIKKNKTGI